MKRKILYYSVATHLGGAERSLFDIVSKIEEFSHHKYEPILLLPKIGGPLHKLAQKRKINVLIIKLPKLILQISRKNPWKNIPFIIFGIPQLLIYFFILFITILRIKPGVIHSTGLKCHLLAVPIGVFIDVKIIWHFRDILKKGTIKKLFSWFGKSKSIYFVANSFATARSIETSKPIEVIYNGIDSKNFLKNPNKIYHKKWNIPQELPIIGIIGVFARWKGQFEFIKMAQILIKNNIKAHFVLIGDEIYDTLSDRGIRKELENLVCELNVSPYVHFWGYELDNVKAINGLDLLVHASIEPEPFGRVIVEAMALEIPVVASRGGGVVELIEDGRTGLLHEPGNVAHLACQVSRVLDEKELVENIVFNAKRKFDSHFTVENYVQNVVNYYNNILK